MSPKTFLFPSIYSTLLIIATCIVFYGGYSQSINTVTIIGWLLIIPFTVVAMIYSKRTIYNNVIGGKDLVKEGLKFVIFSTVILVIFQALFFTIDFRDYKVDFIQTYGFELAKTQIKNGNLKITEAQIPDLIQKEINQVTLFKECTSIVFKNLFLGTITSVIAAVVIRANLKIGAITFGDFKLIGINNGVVIISKSILSVLTPLLLTFILLISFVVLSILLLKSDYIHEKGFIAICITPLIFFGKTLFGVFMVTKKIELNSNDKKIKYLNILKKEIKSIDFIENEISVISNNKQHIINFYARENKLSNIILNSNISNSREILIFLSNNFRSKIS